MISWKANLVGRISMKIFVGFVQFKLLSRAKKKKKYSNLMILALETYFICVKTILLKKVVKVNIRSGIGLTFSKSLMCRNFVISSQMTLVQLYISF